MPPQERSHLKQWAVVWPFAGYDRYSQPVVGFPFETPVRWLDERREVLTPEGNTIALDAVVQVNRRIQMNSWMWKGDLEQWYSGFGAKTCYGTGTAPAAPAYGSGSRAFDNELYEVKFYEETADVKARHAYREVGLIRIPNAHTIPLAKLFPGGLTGDFDSGTHP